VYISEVLTVSLGISHAFSIQKRLQNVGLAAFINLLEFEFVEVYVYEFRSPFISARITLDYVQSSWGTVENS